jgi:hypothetical protein
MSKKVREVQKCEECDANENAKKFSHYLIDYRCAGGRFLMSPRGMTVSNTRYFSSSETRVNTSITGMEIAPI